MIELPKRPKNRHEMNRIVGNHRKIKTKRVRVPEEMRGIVGLSRGYFYANAYIKEVLEAVFQEIVDAGLVDKLKTFDGCICHRYIRGGRRLSVHSWGMAVDFNAFENMMGKRPKMDRKIVKIFEKYGFIWGGRWRRPDGMHFQYMD